MARRVLHDEFFRKAQAQGYLARSAYKLKQIQQAKQIIRPGDRVLDLGCAPGAWLQVAAELVGPQGRVGGIDLQRLRGAFAGNVRHAVGDAFEIDPAELLELVGGEKYDVLLSDMAPKTSGVNDHERSIALCQRVLELAGDVLKPTGNLAMKVFEGGMYPDLLETTGMMFTRVKGYKPKASRGVSREMYVVAHGMLPRDAWG
jgi:23S rRNA (uridine2552-2'-O)-methyltransferase